MAPLPKRKHSTRRKGKRRAALFVSLLKISACPKCGKGRMPHRMCHYCGYYKDRVVVAPKTKKTKKDA